MRLTSLSSVARIAGVLLLVSVATNSAAKAQQNLPGTAWKAEDEVFYHIFVRSFRDSNGDGVGDLDGIRSQLAYLRDLGVTSLLLTPINPSPFYHNYFGSSFEGVDTAYGDSGSLTRLVRAVHERKMRIYLDQEIQYVTPDHAWWRESAGRPGSRYGKFVLYNDSANQQPEAAVFGIGVVPTWSGKKVGLASVNMLEPAVRDYFAQLFVNLADPNHDGRFDDGIDGFRIDHMMDDLDLKGKLTNLFARFWAPIFERVRATNPAITIIAEQYDWGYGDDFLTRGGADMVFAFPIRGSIASLKAADIGKAISGTLERTPAGKGQLIFLENHDTDRFASLMDSDGRKLRLGAALNLLLKGTPLIYYGQELGMRGRQFKGWGTDANDIPVREAFEWGRKEGGPGSATWYRDTGPWWTNRYARDDDGVSAEEELKDPQSLLAFYRRLTALRRARPELQSGAEQVIESGTPDVLAVVRSTATGASLLLANYSSTGICVTVPNGNLPASLRGARLRNLLAERAESRAGAEGCLRLEPYSAGLFAQ